MIENPKKSEPLTLLTRHRPAATLLFLIVGDCLIEFALILSDTGLFFAPHLRGIAYQNGAFWSGLLHDWQPNYAAQPVTMFVTYAFLHGGFLHLFMNMVTLWSFGQVIIEHVGQFRFLVLYLLSLVGAAAMFAMLSTASQPMVGASGALFGLVGVWLVWDCTARYRARASLRPVLKIVILLVVLNIVLWWATGGMLAWQTHLGGFVTGWIAGIFIKPRSSGEHTPAANLSDRIQK